MSAPARRGPARRTQAERREQTIGRIVDATIEALCELGYTRTSVSEIGQRAGVSQGGIFRHFDTRLDIVVAAAAEVAARQLTTFGSLLADTDGSLRTILELTRAATRAPINAAWHELLSAARTDAELRGRMETLITGYYAQIVDLARAQPALAAVPTEVLEPLVLTVIHAFDGEALATVVHPQPELDAVTLDLLEAMLTALLTESPAAN
ncbi:helix-turn-helix domain-containing protein [Jatrophihabitans sp.]|uniref:TetR/AcrR family transcriptional regulator n=1 Tax=Jatrophihabitans sp. TaxID=1932789 RepID=UPI0030C751ED|nr:kstR 6 [Jatrophihabitans sp.]